MFHDPPTERNRVWQTDFSEFETTSGGIWRICAVIDYATKYCLAITITPTSRGTDAVACLRTAVTEATRLTGMADLREDRDNDGRAERRRLGDRADSSAIAVVSDSGPCFRSGTFAGLHRPRSAVAACPHPRAFFTNQRGGGAGLRHIEIRASVSGDRRR